MKIIILDDAEQDLIDGFHFYERQERGLGDYFLDSVMSDIDSLQLFGGIHAVYFGKQRMMCKRFPFGVYYEVQDETVRIIAVLDQRRDPAWIRKRVE
ncbi:MAG: type II toxin-antitoxin system RelE/ParE family toxin [Phycisphaeraceae bacterium]